ncbi:MAG TPA: polysaccharide deacetylase family protein [Bacillales bacterium]|nr:polysaccharide deacetylase family protein [Bacillales bacterium]
MAKQLLTWIVFAFIFIFAFEAVENPWTTRYINGLDDPGQLVAMAEDPLLENIQAAAEKYNRPAINAVIHPVWKAIPGYNGLKVDVKASYANMKKEGSFDKDQLVFKEIQPDISLNDLPPAPIYKGNPKKPMVSLMVNVAWGNEYLPKMLKVMDQEHVHATFFLDGSWVKNNPKAAKSIAKAGHEIGNHAYSHPDLKAMSTANIRRELQRTNAIIERTLQVKPHLFAPPSGSYNSRVVEVAHELGMKTILWTVDTIDWKNPRPQEMVNRVLQRVHGGALILMHPTSSSASGLKGIIDGIRSRGFKLGTVSKVLSEDRL